MKTKPASASRPQSWWEFVDCAVNGPATGEFVAVGPEKVGRLYFPLANEGGMRSWVSPDLQGSPAGSHNEYLGVPLTTEEMPNSLVHRGFWVAEADHEPFSLSRLSAADIGAPARKSKMPLSIVNAGPGWFRVVRDGPGKRYQVRATLWCPADLDAKMEIMTVDVTNTSGRKLAFHAYAAIPLYARSADDVRDHRHVTALLNRVRVDRHGVISTPAMSFDERGHRVNRTHYAVYAFGPGGRAPEGIWPTRDSFLGENGSFAAPAAVHRREPAPDGRLAELQGAEGLGGFCFGETELAAGRSARFVLVSAISDDARQLDRCVKWAKTPRVIERSLESTKKYWAGQIGRVSFKTPDARLNNWLAWVGMQPLLRRLYGNSYLPQFDYGRGGKGWRDLWQDCLALLLSDPVTVRPMLIHNFGGVRIDGSNATIVGTNGLFIADRNNIPRTWMDHGVWPTYTALLYVDQTGDVRFVLKDREYFRDPQVCRCKRRDTAWTEAYGRNLRDRKGRIYRGTILEHMLVQNLTAFFNVGEHNLCRLEGADWNDGLDMAPQRGESVAFSSFYAWNLDRLAGLLDTLKARGVSRVRIARELLMLLDRLPSQKRVSYGSRKAKSARLAAYLDVVARDVAGSKVSVVTDELARDLRAKSRDLAARIGRQEWVRGAGGSSFFNGYYDNEARRVEGVQRGRTRMMLTSQVFPLMAGIATDEQADAIERAVRSHLKDPVTGGVRLNTDFGAIQPALGRAFSFAYGEKENGAVFSHMAIMYAFALYLRRRPASGRAVWASLFCAAMNSPVARTFPCIPEYFNARGRALYSYLTGSASWMIHLLLTQVYGVRGELGDLVIDPQLEARDFDGSGECAVSLYFAERPLTVVFRGPGGRFRGALRVVRVTVGETSLAFLRRPEGGISLKRALIRRLPGGRHTRLTVELGSVEK